MEKLDEKGKYVAKLFNLLIDYYDKYGKEVPDTQGKEFTTLITALSNIDDVVGKEMHSSVGKVIYDLDDEQFEMIKTVFPQKESTFDAVTEGIDLLSEHSDTLAKFRDSVLLSIKQREFVIKESIKESIRANDLAKQVVEELESIKTTKNSIYTDFIAILGIFSTLIFGLFGGVDQLSSIINSSVKNGISKTLIFGPLISIAVIVLIFLLLHSIGMLTNTKMHACGCTDVSNCAHSYAQRYPVFFLGILGCLGIFIVGLISYIWTVKLPYTLTVKLPYINIHISRNNEYTILLGLLAIILFGIVRRLVILSVKQPHHRTLRDTQND